MHHVQVYLDVSKNTSIMLSVTQKYGASRAWKLMPIVPALRRLKQEDYYDLLTNQGYRIDPVSKEQKEGWEGHAQSILYTCIKMSLCNPVPCTIKMQQGGKLLKTVLTITCSIILGSDNECCYYFMYHCHFREHIPFTY